MGWPKGKGPIRSEASAKYMGKAKTVGPMSKAPKFSPAQIRSIKQSPKGVLPKFLQGGLYKDKNVVSVGGRAGKIGGTIGYDKKKKKPFGSVNVGGKVKAKFGPQGY